ncbi:MAG: TRAM domain-containing protein [Nocardiopsaceae bacterium]|nr:TRAM domain-containing protein [Nocardiopsaceae bacterium]
MRNENAQPFQVGDVLETDVGEAVHGGWCIARPGHSESSAQGGGPVLFVRHALPGELVKAVVTQTTAKFARADAIEIINAAPERVSAPCPYARPGGCGGCDWQHASLPAQREIKAHVISQQIKRIAGLERQVFVEELPGGDAGLGWRTRVRFAVGRDGRAGLYRHRSHEITPVSDCLIAHPLVTGAGVTRKTWAGARSVEVAASPGTGDHALLIRWRGRRAGGGTAEQRTQDPGPPGSPRFLTYRAAGREWRVSASGFWQVHPGAADVLAEAVMAALAPRPGQTALDLFCGAGLFAGVLAGAVGPDGAVVAVEQDEAAARDARHNLRLTPWARVHCGDASQVMARLGLGDATIAVLDPPRTGATRELIDVLCSGGLRRIAYVSCDPATLARDIAVFGQHGWRLLQLRGFDAFPMTHHVESLAVLVPPPG